MKKTVRRLGFGILALIFSMNIMQVSAFAEKNLHEGKDMFFLNTCGAPAGVYFNAIRKITEAKHCRELGAYQCKGYDTYGPFIIVGGIAKGHPNEKRSKVQLSFIGH